MFAAARTSWQVGLKTALSALACVFLAAFLHMTMQSYRASTEQRRDIEKQGHDATVQLSRLVDRLIAERSYALKVLATSPLLKSEELSAFYGYAKAVVDTEDGPVEVSDVNRGMLLSTAVPDGSSMPPARDMDTTRRAVASGEIEMSGVFRSPLVGTPVVSMVKSIEGTTSVVRMTLQTQWFADRIIGMVHPGWQLTILDQEGRIIASKGDTQQNLGVPAADDMRKAVAMAPSGWSPTSALDGRKLWSSWLRLSKGWTVIASIDEQRIQSLKRSNSPFLAAATTGFFGLTLALMLGYALGRPFSRLTSAANACGRGERVEHTSSGIREPNSVMIALEHGSQDRTEAEAALRLSEQRLRTLVDAASIMTWTASPCGLHIKPQAQSMVFTGRPDEVLRVDPVDNLHPDYRENVTSQWADAVARGEPFLSEHRMLRHDGVWRWIESRAAPIRDDSGTILEWVGMCADVTDRRAAAEDLRRSQDTLRIVKTAAGLGLYDFNCETNQVTCDDRFREVWGFSGDQDLTQERILERIHPEDLEAVQQAIARATDPNGDGMFRSTHRVLSGADKPERWIEGTGQFFFDGARPLRAVGSVLDVTERKHAETALRASEERLRSVTDHAAVGLVTLDWNRRYTFVNPAYVRILGLTQSPGELIGSGPAEALSSIYESQIAPHLDRAFAGERVSYELARPGEDGGMSRHYTVVYDPIRDADGSATGITVIIFDITERKQAEEALIRTAGLRAVGQLAGGIAHDFGNLLTVISGNLQLAEMELKGGKALAFVHDALDAAERGASLNYRLLSLTGHRRKSARVVDINSQLDQTASLLRRTLGESIAIQVHLSAHTCQAIIDPAELDSALFNLALNARDAMPNGGELILATHGVLRDPNIAQLDKVRRWSDYLRIDVEDNGGGMSADVLRRATEPFFTTKAQGKGAGLGLTSVLRTIEAAGGFVDLKSTSGHGTMVSLYLPQFTSSEPQQPDVLPSPPRRHGDGELILVVEDDPDVCDVVEKRLKSLGYTVRSAATGRAALEMAECGTVRLLFSDIMLPSGMSGIDLAHEMEARAVGIPVLLTSAYNVEAKLNDGLRILMKPYSMAQLAEAIHTALHGRDTPQMPPTHTGEKSECQ